MFELHIKNLKDNKTALIGEFKSNEDIDTFFKSIFEIVEINPEQFLLIQKEYDESNLEIKRRNLVGVYATRQEVEAFIQETHIVKPIAPSITQLD